MGLVERHGRHIGGGAGAHLGCERGEQPETTLILPLNPYSHAHHRT